jgi:hypothetical protein
MKTPQNQSLPRAYTEAPVPTDHAHATFRGIGMRSPPRHLPSFSPPPPNSYSSVRSRLPVVSGTVTAQALHARTIGTCLPPTRTPLCRRRPPKRLDPHLMPPGNKVALRLGYMPAQTPIRPTAHVNRIRKKRPNRYAKLASPALVPLLQVPHSRLCHSPTPRPSSN